MKIVVIWVALVLGGMALFLNIGDIDKYTMQYFVWDKGKDVLAVFGFMMFLKRDKWKLLPVLIFLIIRLIWEPLAEILQVSINNKMAMNILFGCLILVYTAYFLKEQKWRK